MASEELHARRRAGSPTGNSQDWTDGEGIDELCHRSLKCPAASGYNVKADQAGAKWPESDISGTQVPFEMIRCSSACRWLGVVHKAEELQPDLIAGDLSAALDAVLTAVSLSAVACRLRNLRRKPRAPHLSSPSNLQLGSFDARFL
jgi:hypothetical protein